VAAPRRGRSPDRPGHRRLPPLPPLLAVVVVVVVAVAVDSSETLN
jgi:hypothetical protein